MIAAAVSIGFLVSCAGYTFLAVTNYKRGFVDVALANATLSMMTAACSIYHAVKAIGGAL